MKLYKTLSLLNLNLLFLSCSHNYEPIISSISANPNPVEPEGTVNLICNASDNDESNILKNETLTYVWFSEHGEILSGIESHTAMWYAPSDSGIFSISCEVRDQNNGLDISIIEIAVK
ncbi:MAG: hypothetical protein ACJZ12_03075 [Candidatus Neomarinimicrobiota bacterium]